MKFRFRILAFLLMAAAFALSSCRSTATLHQETSSLNLATEFLEGYETPRSEREIKASYALITAESRRSTPYANYQQYVLWQQDRLKATHLRVQYIPWEKYDLSDGSSLVTVMKNYDYHRLTRRFTRYALLQLRVARDGDAYRVLWNGDDPEGSVVLVASGLLKELDDASSQALRELIRESASREQFKVSMELEPSPAARLAEECIRSGEGLYDRELYREALMQFQKAVQLDPGNARALVYIKRCKKAINLGLTR